MRVVLLGALGLRVVLVVAVGPAAVVGVARGGDVGVTAGSGVRAVDVAAVVEGRPRWLVGAAVVRRAVDGEGAEGALVVIAEEGEGLLGAVASDPLRGEDDAEGEAFSSPSELAPQAAKAAHATTLRRVDDHRVLGLLGAA